MQAPIYLDYASTTPMDPRVRDAMVGCLTADGTFGNPASRSHLFGWQAEEAVDIARNQIADAVNADPREIVFTSGATESDNLAIKGVAQANAHKGKHLITLTTEHKAVLDSFAQLEAEGFEVTYLNPETDGLLDINKLKTALRSDTTLVSVMHVNNEIGVVQDIQAIGELCRAHGVYLHVDAAQSIGKVALDLQQLPVDLMSFSAHKSYGPKGIGALFVRRRPKIPLQAQIHGGGHERGLRSGTLATHQIVGMGKAFAIASEEFATEQARITELRDRLWQGIQQLPEVYLNGSLTQRVPHNLNVSFGYVEGESLLMALHELAVSTGSACASASLEPSYVLKALGLDDELAHASIRFSVGRFTTPADIDRAVAHIQQSVSKLREVSPRWQARG